jgi:Ras GTPase-activating-like protein IQGAP2/3
LGNAPKVLHRKENRLITLELFSRWDQTTISAPSAACSDQITRAEFLYYDTKSLLVQILRFLPHFANSNLSLPNLIKTASNSKDGVLVWKGLKVAGMFEELKQSNIISPSDNFKLMTEEILEEFVHLGNLAENLKKEISSLDVVYKTIQEHNNYLNSQLETYKAYLQNVRVQSVPSIHSSKKKLGIVKFTYQKLDADGIICETNVPENRYKLFNLDGITFSLPLTAQSPEIL